MSRAKNINHDRRHKKVREGWAIVRVSTVERGRTQHGSLEAQETMIRRWEKAIFEETAIKYNITKVIEEKASAKRENTHRRHELLRLVQLIELGAIDFIVVEKLDRLSRDEVFNLELMKKVIDYNVELFFIEGGKMDFRNQGDRWRFKLDNIRAGEYSEDLSEKVLRKQRVAMVEAGKDSSPSPILGLTKHPEMAGKYEVDRTELRIAVDIMERFCTLGGSRKGILEYCQQKGFVTKKWLTEKKVDESGKIIKPRIIGGHQFTWNTVMTLLESPKYRGYNRFYDSFNQYPERQDKKGIVTWEYHHHRVHGDIINSDLLKAVDELTEKADRKSRDNEFFLSGILFSPDGSRYGGEFTKKKAYYHNRKIGRRFGSEHLHRIVMNRLKQYFTESGLLEELISRMAEHKDFGLPKIKQQKEWIESEIKKLEQVSGNFAEAIRSAAMNGEKDLASVVQVLLQQKEKAEQDLEQMHLNLRNAKEEESNFKESLNGERLIDYLKLVMANFSSLHHLEQKHVIQGLIPKAIVHTGETENTLELILDLNPAVPPSQKRKGQPSSAIRPRHSAKIYKFPNRSSSRDLPAAVGAENAKGHFSYPTRSGCGEEKWPFIKIGRGDRI